MRSRRRSRGRRRGTAPARAAVAALLASIAAPAAADDVEPIRIAVSAPAGCADTDGFVAEVTARTARARLAAPGEAARSFTVTITATGKKARGTLVIEDPRGPGGTREMKGESCAEVASALALVTALAIDPKASTAAKPPPPPRPPPPPPKPIELPRNPKQLPFAPLPWWGPIGAPLPVPPGTAPSSHWRITAALQIGAASAIAPGLSLVLSGSVDVARIGPGVLAPAFRLSYLTADSGDLTVNLPARAPTSVPQVAPHARLRWAAARADACPVRFAIVGPLTASPCAFFEAGALQASGTAFNAVPAVTRPWAAPGVLGRIQLAVADGVLFELQGGATFPLIRDTFTFTDPFRTGGDATAHAVPAAGGFVSGGVGMHFP